MKIVRADGDHIFSVGEVDAGFDQGQGIGKVIGQFVGKGYESATAQEPSGSQLGVGLGGDDRSHAFRLGQRELAVEERSGGELAGLGPAGFDADGPSRVDQGVDDAMQEIRIAGHLQLSRVLARVRMRRGKGQ